MFSNHMLGLLYDAPKEWQEIGQEPSETISQVYLRHALLLALIPPFALYLGSTHMGWSTADGELVYLATDSAAVMAVAFYFSLLIGLALMSFVMHALEHILGSTVSYERCLMLTLYTSTPLFLAGIAGVMPVLWFDVMVVLLAATYSIYLLFTGVPVLMDMPPAKGAVFSLLVTLIGLCMLVAGMGITVILWGMGIAPGYLPG